MAVGVFEDVEGDDELEGNGEDEADGVEELEEAGEEVPGEGEEDDLLGGGAIGKAAE